MSPIPHHRQKFETVIPPPPEGRNGSAPYQIYEDLPVPQTITETMLVFFTITDVQTLTVAAQVTATKTVAATTIFTAPPVVSRTNSLAVSTLDSSPSPSPSPSSSPPSSSPTTFSSSPTTSALSSTASTSSSTLQLFPSFPTGPIPPVSPIPTVSPSQVGSKLSSGGIAGVILSCILFVVLLGVCFVRFRSTRRRKKDRAWVTPFVEEKPVVRVSVKQRQDKRMEAFAERWERLRRRNCRNEGQSNSRDATSGAATVGRGDRNGPPTRPRGHHDPVRRLPALPAPSGHRSRRGPSSPPPVYRGPSARRPVQDDMLVSSLFPHGAVAKLHFHPERPDELEVFPGDYLRVIALFDDGWAQCKAVTGQKGMVPTACLRINDVRRIIP